MHARSRVASRTFVVIIHTYFKGNRTLKNILVPPKIRSPWNKKWNYLLVKGPELARIFGKRFREHLKVSSLIYGHYSTTGHPNTLDNFRIVAREGQGFTRKSRNPCLKRENNLTLSRNIGKCNIPHIRDRVVNNTTELQVKNK